MTLKDEIRRVINQNSAENGSNTPDFILAEYLLDCLEAFDRAVNDREKWYGVSLAPQEVCFVDRSKNDVEEKEVQDGTGV